MLARTGSIDEALRAFCTPYATAPCGALVRDRVRSNGDIPYCSIKISSAEP